MNYNVYKRARDAAWQFLIDNCIDSLPVRFGELCEKNGIVLLRDPCNYYLGKQQRGVTYIRNNRYHILVNGMDHLSIQRFTIAHELGHIYMNHDLTDSPLGRSFGVHYHPVLPEEYQAERFAMGILAPACVLWGLDLHSPKDIAKVCYISIEDARYRADRMRDLYKRDVFLASELEKRVFEQFKSFVETKKAPLAGA